MSRLGSSTGSQPSRIQSNSFTNAATFTIRQTNTASRGMIPVSKYAGALQPRPFLKETQSIQRSLKFPVDSYQSILRNETRDLVDREEWPDWLGAFALLAATGRSGCSPPQSIGSFKT